APAGTPAPIINALNAAIAKVVVMPDVVARFKTDAVEPATGSPAAMASFIEADYRAWRDVVVSQKLKIE
ncbi:MAG: tripartite tricarboxylate transporter substrate binding protein, partial [Haliea sp.]